MTAVGIWQRDECEKQIFPCNSDLRCCFLVILGAFPLHFKSISAFLLRCRVFFCNQSLSKRLRIFCAASGMTVPGPKTSATPALKRKS